MRGGNLRSYKCRRLRWWWY